MSEEEKSVKKVTIMVLDSANKGHRAVFDGTGKCIQGEEEGVKALMNSFASQQLAANDSEEADEPTKPVEPAAPVPARTASTSEPTPDNK